jgi:membrane protein implicated in regulation of membrane protease activity
MPVSVIWILVALALVAVELHNAAFYAIFMAAGAFVAAFVAWLLPDGSVGVQALVAVVVAMLGTLFFRPMLYQRFRRPYAGVVSRGVAGGLVGDVALTADEVGDVLHPGHVTLAGERWLAFTEGPGPIPAGVGVAVTAVRGTTLVVAPVADAAGVGGSRSATPQSEG